MMKAIVFPGQGAQYPGMGKDLYDNFPQAREIFSYIDNFSGLKISQICFEGSAQDLKKPSFQQLAILATSLATYEVFKEKNISVDFLSGLSLGEYACLYPADVLDLKDIVYLIKERAQATERAVKLCLSSMLAVVGLERDALAAKGKKEGFYIANINSPEQIVISLKKEDKKRIKKSLRNSGAKVVELKVDGGFHSPLMEEARKQFGGAVNSLEFKDAEIPIVSNVTASAHTNKDEIKNNFIEELTSPVLWWDCVECMIKNGVEVFFEIGPSQILNRLIKEINPQAKVIAIEKKEDLDKLT